MEIIGYIYQTKGKEGVFYLEDVYDKKRYICAFLDLPMPKRYAKAVVKPFTDESNSSGKTYSGFAIEGSFSYINMPSNLINEYKADRRAEDSYYRVSGIAAPPAKPPVRPPTKPPVSPTNWWDKTFKATTPRNEIKDAPHPSNQKLIVVQVNLQ